MRVTAVEKMLAAKTNWLEWYVREQAWLIRIWDHGLATDGHRSMFMLLTEEQREVVFAGLEKKAGEPKPNDEPDYDAMLMRSVTGCVRDGGKLIFSFPDEDCARIGFRLIRDGIKKGVANGD